MDAPPDLVPKSRPLEYLPINVFAATMGLPGLSVAWKLAARCFGTPLWISTLIGAVALVVFAVLLAAYGVKCLCAWDRVVAEFRHPIAGNLFGTLLISLLLMPIPLVSYSLTAAQVLWVIGAVGMTGFAWLIVSRWMNDRQHVAHATPAWIVPVVGLVDMPLAMPLLQLPPLPGVMMFSCAVGLFFAVPLFTLVVSRLLFEEPLPDALQPTLLILSAPFSVGFSCYVVTVGRIDRMAEALYYLTLFILSVLLGRLRVLMRLSFRLTWWATSFPLAAAAIAALRFLSYQDDAFTRTVAWLLLGFTTLAIAGLLVATLVNVARGRLQAMSS